MILKGHSIVENNAGGLVWYVVVDAKGVPVAQGDYTLCRGACIQHDARLKGTMMGLTLNDAAGSIATIMDNILQRPEVRKGASDAVLMISAVQAVQACTLQNLKTLIEPQIQDVVDTLILSNGEREGLNDFEKSEWDEAADDAISGLFERYSDILSANWLGVATIDTRLHERAATTKLADAFSQEAWKILTYDGTTKRQKDGSTILSDIGISIHDLKSLSTAPNMKTILEKKGNDMTLDEVVGRLFDFCGGVFDESEYAPQLALAADDDDILAKGAIERLGGDMNCVEALRTAYFEHGDDLPAIIMQKLADYDPSSPAALPAAQVQPEAFVPPKPAKVKGPTKKDKIAQEALAPGAIPQTVLELLKAHSAAKDQDLADGIGTSRATFNNYVNGKAVLVANPEQRQFLVKLLRSHRDGLSEALNQLGEA